MLSSPGPGGGARASEIGLDVPASECEGQSGGGVIDTSDPRYREVFLEIHSGLPREAPGADDATRRALAAMAELPLDPLILDLGCGPGAAATLLARETGGRVVGLDLHGAFPREVRARARRVGLDSQLFAVHGDMVSAPFAPARFDVVWSEGALYGVGVPRGLGVCRDMLKPGGHLAFTEAVWLEAEPPEKIRRWWEGEYPGMATVDANLALIQEAGFVTLDHFTLPASAWWEYYRPLESKLADLRERHAGDRRALEVLAEAQTEVDMYRAHGRSYGYEFFVSRKR